MKINKFIAAATLAAAVASTAALADDAVVATPAPNTVVYVQQLPTPAELTKAAAAQGVTLVQISQTANMISATYKRSDGEVTTVAYEPLSAAGVDAATPGPTVATATPAPSTTVVYTTPVYYDYPYGYPYWGWYPPVAVGIGFGWGWGGHWGGGHWGGWHR